MLLEQKVYDAHRSHSYEEYTDVCGTLSAFMGTGGGNVPLVLEIKDESDSSNCGSPDPEIQ